MPAAPFTFSDEEWSSLLSSSFSFSFLPGTLSQFGREMLNSHGPSRGENLVEQRERE